MLHTRYERSIWRSLSVHTSSNLTQTKAQQHAPAPRATAHDLNRQRKPMAESSTAFLRPASTRGDQAVHAVWCRRNSCVRACLAARGLTCLTKREQRAQRAHRCALPPTLPRRGCERSLPAHAEGTHSSSAVQAFRAGSSIGTAGDLSAVPAAHAGSVPCDPGIRREASLAVCSFSRISKPL